MSRYTLKDFGNYTVAGRLHQVTHGEPRSIRFTRSASYRYDPKGLFAVEHAYVQYFIPEPRRPGPPLVLVHGGGLHGSTWETTPDGRPGWLNLLVQQGFEVHVIDNVERGRSGFAVDVWEDQPIPRSLQEAWTLFRLGHETDFDQRIAFEGTRFPVDNFNEFARMLVPRWLTTTPLQVDALLAVLQRTGPAIVFCHSQGGEIAIDALQQCPDSVAALVAIEPSVNVRDYDVIKNIPTVLMAGDYLSCATHWQERLEGWRSWVDAVQQDTGKAMMLDSRGALQSGHTHLPMLDYGNDQCLSLCLEALEAFGCLSMR